MVNVQPEALHLANQCDPHDAFELACGNLLRQLCAENAALKEKLQVATHSALDHKGRGDELLAALEEAEYALDYAADMTKPEGLSGCDCPICSVSVKVRAAIAKAGGAA